MDKIKEILKKAALDQNDIDFLAKNIRFLSEADKVRLGFITPIEQVVAPVIEEEVVIEEKPKKRRIK